MTTNISIYKKTLTLVRKANVGSFSPADAEQWLNIALRNVYDEKLPLIDTNSRVIEDMLPYKKTGLVTAENEHIILDSGFVKLANATLYLDGVIVPSFNLLPDAEINNVLNSSFRKPSKRQCYYSHIEDAGHKTLKLYCPLATEKKVSIIYYSAPAKITLSINESGNIVSQDINITDSMENEVASRCALMYIESINDQRYQTLQAEINKLNNNQ